MFKFLAGTINTPDGAKITSPLILHLPRLFFLYKRYERFLHDDYTENMSFKQFIKFVTDSNFFWLIQEASTGIPAGFVYLDNITGSENHLHSAEITTCFEQKFWGEKTYICAMEFFDYVFKTFGFYKIKAQIYPQNFRVKTLLKKCGFKLECILKNETLRKVQLQDIELYALMNKKKCEEQ